MVSYARLTFKINSEEASTRQGLSYLISAPAAFAFYFVSHSWQKLTAADFAPPPLGLSRMAMVPTFKVPAPQRPLCSLHAAHSTAVPARLQTQHGKG